MDWIRTAYRAAGKGVWTPVKKLFRAPQQSSRGGPVKNIYTKSERQTSSCRVTWVWSERVNLYSRQVMIVARKTKTCATQSSPGPPSGPPGPIICTGFPPSRRHCWLRVRVQCRQIQVPTRIPKVGADLPAACRQVGIVEGGRLSALTADQSQ